MIIGFFQIIFFILVVTTIFIFPISGFYEIRKLKKGIANGDKNKKVKFYRQNIFWSWIPIILIFILVPVSGIKLENIGIKWIDISSISKWIIFPTIGLYIIYLIYKIYTIVILKYNKESRTQAAKSIADDLRCFLPITRNEIRIWPCVAISAGLTEE